ncbi:GLPGLI family protein [Crocinitomicaceae bacterium CZZ-1]|uniref:GLPGLI family protein n=1 Tax=Taishania pollutisoli TaxID=2766479 RepID=A0A8J6U2I2_9FLAO|nr:GLPGLI family protein [Taishania pollutisoli]MBC9813060.1 GLPGLI family protein [Taishania pollutisoli]
MKKANKIRTVLLVASVLFAVGYSRAQMQEGKIVFERKTNLFKKYTNKSTQDYIKEENKYKIDNFTLYFNDSVSVFVPEENYENNRLSWTTNSNTVVQDFRNNETKTIYSFSGAPVLVKDSLQKRQWKLTDKWRTICQIECMQAVYELDDSTRIYAWFTASITPNIGPESFWDLPGAILGLATEDGAVTYFAKSIEERKIDMEVVMPKFKDKKARTREEVMEQAKKDFKFEKEIDSYLKSLFMW